MFRLAKDGFLLVLISTLMIVLLERMDSAIKPLQVRGLQEVIESGELIVLTQNSPNTYYVDRHDQPAGPEYELVLAFAEFLGVAPRFVLKNSLVQLLDALETMQVDLAASGLTDTLQRSKRFLTGPAYVDVTQQVVCRRGEANPRSVKDLAKVNLAVLSGSSFEERLQKWRLTYPELNWTSVADASGDELAERVWLRELDCTILDSSVIALNQRYYPELKVRFDLAEPESVVWLLPKGSSELQEAALAWFDVFKQSGDLEDILERYFGHFESFDYVDTAAFIRRIGVRYPNYRPMFREAAAAYGLSEALLAAQAYQESHWSPRAVSPTGVRGMMMLTLITAKSMGVENRLDVKQSIEGGAKYFAKLRALLAKDVTEPDLSWFALAAYNVGLGHLRDAQALTRTSGGDPFRWSDVKEMLPLLSDPKFYKNTRYGYARGIEPVRYVQQIRHYELIFRKHFKLDENPEMVARNEPVVEENEPL